MTTLNLQVTASADDAFENAAGAVTLTGLTIPLSAGGQWGGLRFLNVTIPQGATISTATLQLYVNSTATDTIVADFYGQAADDAGTFTTGTGDISARSRTTAKVSVNSANVGTGWYNVTGMASVIEEITDRGGWASGNDLVIIIDPLPGVDLQFRTYDHDTTLAAKLDIVYVSAQTLTGAYISSTTTLYAPSKISHKLAGATVAATTTFYAPTKISHKLTGAFISSTTTIYTPPLIAITSAQSLTMTATIANAPTLYAPGMVHRGPLRIAYVATGRLENVSSASIPFPPADDSTRVVAFWITGQDMDAISINVASSLGAQGHIDAQSSFEHLYVFWDIGPAADFIPFTSDAPVDLVWGIVVLSGVETWRIASGDLTTGADTDVSVSETFNTNGMIVAGSGFDAAFLDSISSLSSVITLDSEQDSAGNGLILTARPVATAGAASYDIGIDVSYTGGSPAFEVVFALWARGYTPFVTNPHIGSTTTLYAPASITHAGQTLNGATIEATTTLYAPAKLSQTLTGAFIASTTALYAPSNLTHKLTGAYLTATTALYTPAMALGTGHAQVIYLPFMGQGVPAGLNGPFLTLGEMFAPSLFTVFLTMTAFIESTVTINDPATIVSVRHMTGAVYTPVSIQHV